MVASACASQSTFTQRHDRQQHDAGVQLAPLFSELPAYVLESIWLILMIGLEHFIDRPSLNNLQYS
jgi:hypothetical protein